MKSKIFSISEIMGSKQTATTKKQLIEVCDDVFTTEQQQEAFYETKLLAKTFKELYKDGVIGIGFSLLIDLANERAARIERD